MPVISTLVGKYFCSSGVSSGQPSVPMGQRPEREPGVQDVGIRQTG